VKPSGTHAKKSGAFVIDRRSDCPSAIVYRHPGTESDDNLRCW
jgi:hypothetical protein